MGQKVTLTCDMHKNNTEAVQTLRFNVGSHAYEVDLCDKHLKEFDDKLAPFIDGARQASHPGRKVEGRRPVGPKKTGRARKSSPALTDVTAMRDWARSNGYEVSSRGRLAGAVVEAYNAAGGD